MLAAAIAAAKISFDTFTMISFSAMLSDARKIGLVVAYSNHACLSIILQQPTHAFVC
jgi:hypothetical protein